MAATTQWDVLGLPMTPWIYYRWVHHHNKQEVCVVMFWVNRGLPGSLGTIRKPHSYMLLIRETPLDRRSHEVCVFGLSKAPAIEMVVTQEDKSIELLDVDPQETEDDGAVEVLDSKRKGKRTVIKTLTRQTYFLPVFSLVDPEKLKPDDLVGVNKDSHFRPTEQYSDIGGLDRQIQKLIEAVVLPTTHKDKFKNLRIHPPKSTYLKMASQQLVQMFIGDGAKLVWDASALTKEKSPVRVLFQLAIRPHDERKDPFLLQPLCYLSIPVVHQTARSHDQNPLHNRLPVRSLILQGVDQRQRLQRLPQSHLVGQNRSQLFRVFAFHSQNPSRWCGRKCLATQYGTQPFVILPLIERRLPHHQRNKILRNQGCHI
ncbi:26S protease regulatory subunit 6a [Culex quinquefasciatus]|uniref:26S protease regulatory subunit 6a n=1 Tax=Culex quinquefasciatus TaxID=7176 RepID=B0XAM3_CULQU|nr:26S protease regulatory subunit 6a [Culex quinquefasciatus]|eukprot:XP_001866695.1 26S protease regulatory subunit 6a [Culex quinquefasciatus]